MNNIYQRLNIKNPYNRIRANLLAFTPSQNWGGRSPIFEEYILETRPKIILELGCFLGDSTITMANVLKKESLDSHIITVDTWLGSQEHWLQDKCNLLHEFSYFEYGIGTLYDKCLSNFIHKQVEDYIIPMPTTTDTAYDVLNSLGFKFDMIYMDADHRYDVVYSDLCKYYNLLNPNGILFGHDVDWEPVKNAVVMFSNEHNKRIETANDENGQEKFWRIL